jgi:hypothetical protein
VLPPLLLPPPPLPPLPPPLLLLLPALLPLVAHITRMVQAPLPSCFQPQKASFSAHFSAHL